MDEAALGATTRNLHFGRCENPAVAGHTPGGSSGGSAAAVAAGLCAAALGSDTLGSVRIPAAYCGVTGFIATRGLVSRTGVSALSVTLDQVGVLARTIDDSALVMAALFGCDATDAQSSPLADNCAQQFFRQLQDAEAQARQVSVGCPDLALYCDAAEREIISQGIRQARSVLAAAGHEVADCPCPSGSFTSLRREALLIIEAEGYVAAEGWLHLERVSPELKKMLSYGAGLPASRIEKARANLEHARTQWLALLEAHEVILLPVAPQGSFSHDQKAPPNQADFTTPASIAGLPAVSIPLGRSADGRCMAVQLVARPYAEATLLTLARQIEAAVNSA